MRTLVFDTETTGKADHKTPDHTVQPYPVQLACILVEGDKIMNMANIIIDPGKPVEKEAAAVHGIDDKMIEAFGLSMRAAAGLFINFLNRCDRIVAHNIDFDIIITEAMIFRTLMKYNMQQFRDIPRVCTMLSAKDVCKLPGKFRDFKWPTLEEAYKILVDKKGFHGAHDAYYDVVACWRVLKKLEEMGAPLVRGKR